MKLRLSAPRSPKAGLRALERPLPPNARRSKLADRGRAASVQCFNRETVASASGLHCACGKAGDDIALSQKEDQDRGQNRQSDEREDELPRRRVLALIGHKPEGPGIARLAVEHDERQQIAVPASDKG